MSGTLIRRYVKQNKIWPLLDLKGKELKSFLSAAGYESYLLKRENGAILSLECLKSLNDVGRLGAEDQLIQVFTSAQELSIVYAALKDKHGELFDLSLQLSARISDTRSFLEESGLDWIMTEESVSFVSLESFITEMLKCNVVEEMQTVSYESLTTDDACPSGWWANMLPNWLGKRWLKWGDIKKISYCSDAVDLKKVVEQRKKLAEVEDDERKQRSYQEIARQRVETKCAMEKHAIEVNFEEAVRDVDADQEKSARKRRTDLAKVELECEKDILLMQQELELSRLAFAEKKLVIESNIDRLLKREDAAQEKLEQAEASERRAHEIVDQMGHSQKELVDQIKLLVEAFADGVQNPVQLSQFASSVSPETMNRLGTKEIVPYFSKLMMKHARRSGKRLRLQKLEIHTRDIGPHRVNTLKIDDPLHFTFQSEKAGYATILNIGTSGRVLVHAPNPYLTSEQCRVEAGCEYTVPDFIMLPCGMDYVENGPAGWEELLVIVSGQPLISTEDIRMASPDNPFAVLPQNRIYRLLEQLEEAGEDSWNTGALRFLVE
jgi:hypothetical protein